MNRTTSGIVLSEFVLSGDPLYKIEQDFTTLSLFDTNNFKKQKIYIAICFNRFCLLKRKILLLVSIPMCARIFMLKCTERFSIDQ